MKVKPIPSLIAFALACLIGYLAYVIAGTDENNVMCGICSTVCFAVSLVCMMGVSHESDRMSVNIRMVCGVFFFIFLVSNFAFAVFGVAMPFYLIINAILLLVFLAMFYKFASIKDV